MTPEEPPVNPHQPPAAPEPAAAPPRAPERDPFWGYGDVLWFLGLAIASVLASWVVGMARDEVGESRNWWRLPSAWSCCTVWFSARCA